MVHTTRNLTGNGTCHGEPFWQPTGDKIAGALELDGIDDYITTDFVSNPIKESSWRLLRASVSLSNSSCSSD